MKVFVFWLALTLLPAIALATAGPSLAACYSTSDAGYAACAQGAAMGTGGNALCSSPAGCCNNYDPCSLLTNPGTPPNPADDPTCGGTSQPCCSGNTCDSSDLECRTTYGGKYCLGQAQIDQLGGGSSPSDQSPLCGEDNLGVQTAIGCLMAGDPKQLISQLLGWGVTVGGGIAFLMIVLAGFQMTTAGGDPKKVQAARELLISAISGLILIVLSIVLLNFIGVKILNLPGFAGNPDLNL